MPLPVAAAAATAALAEELLPSRELPPIVEDAACSFASVDDPAGSDEEDVCVPAPSEPDDAPAVSVSCSDEAVDEDAVSVLSALRQTKNPPRKFVQDLPWFPEREPSCRIMLRLF